MYYAEEDTIKNYQKAYNLFLICDYLKYKQVIVKESINELEQNLPALSLRIYKLRVVIKVSLAEREGFEPSMRLLPYTRSRRAP